VTAASRLELACPKSRAVSTIKKGSMGESLCEVKRKDRVGRSAYYFR
jgi:hypothetical protein